MSKGTGRNRRLRDTITTRSGKTIKLNRTLGDRLKSRKAARATERAAYLATLPKDRLRRLAYRLRPKHLVEYWFSREGGIMALKIIGVAIIVGFFMTIGLFAYFRKDLPKIKDLSGDSLGGNITYYDRTGQVVLFNDYNSIKRVPVDSKAISPYMAEATVAIEDKNFFHEGAFDVRGIIRAGYHDLAGSQGALQGGSTITQQLVKLNEGWGTNRTITRKVKELILAVELEREYTKNDILTGYLNIAPYGGVDYGVQAAAQDYFQTDAAHLTLAQASMLAAIPQSPSYYSPYAGHLYNPAVTSDTFDPQALLARQHYILDLMVTQHYITRQQAEDAKKVDVLAQVHQQSPKYQDIKAPYFVQAAKQELEQTYGANTVQRGGWKVTTTLDMNLQNKAEQLVASNLSNVKRRTAGLADEEASVTEDVQTGQIVALVGGVDFNNPDYGQNNYAAGVLVSPGSSFKPYDYVTLINNNNNVGAGSVLYDSEGPLPGYPCTNKALPKNGGNCLKDYDFLQPGPITLRYALGGSRNIPAVKAMYEAVPNDKSTGHVDSINKVISTASAMMDNTYLQSKHQNAYNCYQQGINVNNASPSDTTQCYGASAIGDGAYLHLDDHVNGLSTLGRLGQAIPRTYILKITDAAQKTLYQWKQPVAKQAVKADAAYIVDNMASDPNASYLPGSCSAYTCTGGYKFQRYDGWNFAVKTGTTNYGFDGLMASWSTKYATVAWVGNHTRNVDITSRTGTAMEYLTEPLTRGMMEYAHTGLKPVNWVQPATVKTAPAFVVRNHIHYGDVEPSPTNDLYPGWYIGGGAKGKTTSQTMDKVSGKIATTCTPAGAKEVVTNGNAASWNIDIFKGGAQSIGSASVGTSTDSTATDNVHNCNDSPPTVTLTAPSTCDGSCTITATVTQGTHALTDPQYAQFPGTIAFTLNGQTIHSENISDSPSTVSFTYNPTSSGSGTLTATVTDSVLYQGSNSATLNFSSPLTLASPTVAGTQITLNWTGGTGTFTAVVSPAPLTTTCDSVQGDSCTITVSPGPYTIYIQDSTGAKSNQQTTSSP
ncbi:MAG TPA: transglycosylase domain-containing protein [Candidatus Dormibacteraeota bacterium]|nr:transglycosylase domain-containing protein [Candidatus Dormibacteraeota bacterium]